MPSNEAFDPHALFVDVAGGHYYTLETESELDPLIEVRVSDERVLVGGTKRVRIGPRFRSEMATITISAAADGPYRLSWDVERAVSIETSLSSMNLILDGHT